MGDAELERRAVRIAERAVADDNFFGHYGEDPPLVAVSRALLALRDRAARDRAALERLVKAARPCVAILRHKEIRPPMQPGVQERMEIELAGALAALRPGTEGT